MKEAKKFPKKLEIIAACRMCGSPIYGPKAIATEESPLVKRSCTCTPPVPFVWCNHTCNCNHWHWTWQSTIPYSTTTLPYAINMQSQFALSADLIATANTNAVDTNATKIQ